ncbi:MAG: hypothetical protein ACK55Z_36605, partial [bacterium]
FKQLEGLAHRHPFPVVQGNHHLNGGLLFGLRVPGHRHPWELSIPSPGIFLSGQACYVVHPSGPQVLDFPFPVHQRDAVRTRRFHVSHVQGVYPLSVPSAFQSGRLGHFVQYQTVLSGPAKEPVDLPAGSLLFTHPQV